MRETEQSARTAEAGQSTSELDELLSTSEVALMLACHASTVRRWSERHGLPCKKTPSGVRKFPKRAVGAWIREHYGDALDLIAPRRGAALPPRTRRKSDAA